MYSNIIIYFLVRSFGIIQDGIWYICLSNMFLIKLDVKQILKRKHKWFVKYTQQCNFIYFGLFYYDTKITIKIKTNCIYFKYWMYLHLTKSEIYIYGVSILRKYK